MVFPQVSVIKQLSVVLILRTYMSHYKYVLCHFLCCHRNVDLSEYLTEEAQATEKNTSYDLVANVVHDGKPTEGSYRIHVLHHVSCDLIFLMLLMDIKKKILFQSFALIFFFSFQINIIIITFLRFITMTFWNRIIKIHFSPCCNLGPKF